MKKDNICRHIWITYFSTIYKTVLRSFNTILVYFENHGSNSEWFYQPTKTKKTLLKALWSIKNWACKIAGCDLLWIDSHTHISLLQTGGRNELLFSSIHCIMLSGSPSWEWFFLATASSPLSSPVLSDMLTKNQHLLEVVKPQEDRAILTEATGAS